MYVATEGEAKDTKSDVVVVGFEVAGHYVRRPAGSVPFK